jgi:hypothetical protein
VDFTLLVGHGPDRQRSTIPTRRIQRLEAIGPDGAVTDLRPRLNRDAPGGDGSAALGRAGTWVLVLATDSGAHNVLPADRFNAYVAAEGLTPADRARRRAGRTAAEGSEIYSRRAKALVQVGPADPRAATRPLGLTLEIVPEVNPAALAPGAALPVQVLYRGRPLDGALVKLTDLAHDESPVASLRTDRFGRARFTVPRAGAWMLNVVWTRPLPKGGEADFETEFSSLSFGVGRP